MFRVVACRRWKNDRVFRRMFVLVQQLVAFFQILFNRRQKREHK